MNRGELQQLAEDRLLDAEALLAAGRWSGAYYLAGYAVECGLKSCILAYVDRTGIIFQEKKYSERCWTHNLEELVKLADLGSDQTAYGVANPAFERNWLIVRDWSEQARYQQISEVDARDFVNAVGIPTDGVLSWVRGHW